MMHNSEFLSGSSQRHEIASHAIINHLLSSIYGDELFASSTIQGTLPELYAAYAAIDPTELSELVRALESNSYYQPSEDASAALFETILNIGDIRGFFMRFLETRSPELCREAKKPGGIRGNLLPEDIPWAIYKNYLLQRRGVELKRQEEAQRPMKDRQLIQEHLNRYRQEAAAPITTPEQEQRLLDLVLLESLTVGKKVNEGMNGVIYLVDIHDFSETHRQAAYASGMFDARDDSAIKILKIQAPDGGSGEANNQLTVERILERAKQNGKNVASVPKVTVNHTIAIDNPDLQTAFRNITGIPSLGSKISCIAMEFIHGEDLASSVWRAYGLSLVQKILHWDKERTTGITEESIDYFNKPNTFLHVREYIDELEQRASALPGMRSQLLERLPRARNDADVLKVRQANDRNAERVTSALQKEGFTIDPGIYHKIAQTIEVLRSEGVVLLDCHERNIMVTPEGDVYFIDFEKCKFVGRPVLGDSDVSAFSDGEMNPAGIPIDRQVIDFIRKFLPTNKK